MRKQLRDFYSDEQLKAVYNKSYRHDQWEDHKQRVQLTSFLAWKLAGRVKAVSGADLSAGDGTILRSLSLPQMIFGDWRPCYAQPSGEDWRYADIEEESTWADMCNVDIFICTETLEHVRDPDLLLRRIRAHSASLILSTPTDEDNSINPEHYWGWGVDDIREMLETAGFTSLDVDLFDAKVPGGYIFQTWTCV